MAPEDKPELKKTSIAASTTQPPACKLKAPAQLVERERVGSKATCCSAQLSPDASYLGCCMQHRKVLRKLFQVTVRFKHQYVKLL